MKERWLETCYCHAGSQSWIEIGSIELSANLSTTRLLQDTWTGCSPYGIYTTIYRSIGFFLLSNLAFVHFTQHPHASHTWDSAWKHWQRTINWSTFLDLGKAFGTLVHSIMLDKLALLGINRSAVQWFRSYLTRRTQSVCVNGLLCGPQPIPFGVPQGSMLGPLLFIIYINDLPLAVQGCCVELYADGTLIYFARKSVSKIPVQLTGGLTDVLSWLHANFLILNS